MRFGVIGINHKQASLHLRESLAQICLKRFSGRLQLHLRHSFILLSTCNRTEVYFSSDDLALTHSYVLNILRNELSDEFEQLLYSFFGTDCLYHLSRVTAGLDSAILSETEIQGQVKAAYLQAKSYANLTKELHYLFQKGLKNGKLIRTHFPSVRGLPDIEHSLYSLMTNHFQGGSVLFVGASKINLKILSFFKKKGMKNIEICNRTNEKALLYSNHFHIHHLPWNEFSKWSEFDCIIFGTKAPRYLLKKSDLPHFSKQKLLIDLSVPRNVDPATASHPNALLYNIDEIHKSVNERRENISAEIAEAERILIRAVIRQSEKKPFHPQVIEELFAYSR